MRAEMGKDPSRAPSSQQLNLPPGFRFFPTDEELVVHYLCKKADCEPFAIPIIAEIELYKFDPWDLPERALFGEKEWYFFSPRDRKYPNGSRPNRAAGTGYWKATGTDKPIHSTAGNKKVGVKKALVFYRGKAPKGIKTNWIMHEYRLADSAARSAKKKGTLRLDDWVLCRIYKKCSAAMSAQRVDKAKEQSETSGLDNGMASVPVFPSRPAGSDIGSTYDDAYVDDKQAVMLQNWYGNTKTTPTTGASEYNLYAQQPLRGWMFGSVAEEPTQKHSGITFEQQVAASSADVSNVGSPSNVYSSRPTSEGSRHDDDAAESTFNTLPSFSAEQLTAFPQSLYGLDATGLLPSPTSLLVGQAGSFSSLLESDCNGFFASADYNLQMRPFAKGPHLGTWDNKIGFAT